MHVYIQQYNLRYRRNHFIIIISLLTGYQILPIIIKISHYKCHKNVIDIKL